MTERPLSPSLLRHRGFPRRNEESLYGNVDLFLSETYGIFASVNMHKHALLWRVFYIWTYSAHVVSLLTEAFFSLKAPLSKVRTKDIPDALITSSLQLITLLAGRRIMSSSMRTESSCTCTDHHTVFTNLWKAPRCDRKSPEVHITSEYFINIMMFSSGKWSGNITVYKSRAKCLF